MGFSLFFATFSQCTEIPHSIQFVNMLRLSPTSTWSQHLLRRDDTRMDQLTAPSPTSDLHLLQKGPLSFPLKPKDYAPKPVPSTQEFEQLWRVWDLVSLQMLPSQELLSKPIKLRNACVFYLGHRKLMASLQCSCRLYFSPSGRWRHTYDH